MITLATSRAPFFVAIGGIGVSAIARSVLAAGRPVRGTDLMASPVTDALRALGAEIGIGAPPVLPKETDLVVASEAVPADHPLRQAAQQRGIRWLSYADALGELTAPFARRVAVTGTNGKSTTTALLAWIAVQAGADPTVVVGSLVPQLGGNYRRGESDLVIVEADDYRDHFLALTPTLAVVTNVAFDHPDAFRDQADVAGHMVAFLQRREPNATVVLNADDPPSQPLRDATPSALTFTIAGAGAADIALVQTGYGPGRQEVELFERGQSLGRGTLPLPGEYNRANAAAAAATARSLGLAPSRILAGIASFRGLWRRFEILPAPRNRALITDYAHHPDSLRSVIAAARSWYPGWRVLVLFQPHHEDRLRALREGFADALVTADDVVVTEVYRVAGRRSDASVSAETLAVELQRRGRPAMFAADLTQAQTAASDRWRAETVCLVVGAGSVDRVARALAR